MGFEAQVAHHLSNPNLSPPPHFVKSPIDFSSIVGVKKILCLPTVKSHTESVTCLFLHSFKQSCQGEEDQVGYCNHILICLSLKAHICDHSISKGGLCGSYMTDHFISIILVNASPCHLFVF